MTVSQEDFDALSNLVSNLNNKIGELEEWKAFHVGLDWGASTTVNAPHPNQQISTAEFGGGISRLDQTGIQVKAPADGSSVGAIYFVDLFQEDPGAGGANSVLTLQGANDSARRTIQLISYRTIDESSSISAETQSGRSAADSITHLGGQTSGAYVRVDNSDGPSVNLWIDDPSTPQAQLKVSNNLAESDPRIDVVGGPLKLPTNAGDFANLDEDGMVQYDTTEDTIRLRANGSTVNIATEDYAFSLGAGTELTIATGEIGVTDRWHTVDTESDASSDDLDTINGGTTGQVLVLTAADSARTVVVKHGIDNIYLDGGADFSLDHARDSITLLYTGSEWIEISKSDNA